MTMPLPQIGDYLDEKADLDYCDAVAENKEYEIQKEIEAIKSDPTRIGTHHFRYRAAAYRYYMKQGLSRKDVDAKFETNEIAVGAPASVSHFDDDYRYHVYNGDLQALYTKLRQNSEKWNEALRKRQAAKSLAHIIRRSQDAYQVVVDCATKKSVRQGLRDAWNPSWERKLPYCTAGEPRYTPDEYFMEEVHGDNNLIVQFGTTGVSMFVCRNIQPPTKIFWGMRTVGSLHYIFRDGNFMEKAQYMSNVLSHVDPLIGTKP